VKETTTATAKTEMLVIKIKVFLMQITNQLIIIFLTTVIFLPYLTKNFQTLLKIIEKSSNTLNQNLIITQLSTQPKDLLFHKLKIIITYCI